ncbi:MBL fold metallo-hydrolase [Winogradskyella tangerina]|uniref:MBL fold metallo-hydrolase n=1 Tax=Winogradskyella tangerina TaxID=2023240 RepID=UPI000DBE127B|nr:MBL fold metallo-hydrolase [Winogradskyella tangerina]
MVTIRKFEQSAILLTDSKTGQNFAFDFGVFSQAQIPVLPKLKAVFISHEHGDHYLYDNVIAMKSEKIFSADEPHQDLTSKGVEAEKIKDNDVVGYGAIEVTAFEVDHGPISKPISNLGFYIKIGDKNILFCGDMKVPGVVPDIHYDLTLIPVCGGEVIMNADEALSFLSSLRHPGVVVPLHYHGQADPQSGAKFYDYASHKFDVKVLDVNDKLHLT